MNPEQIPCSSLKITLIVSRPHRFRLMWFKPHSMDEMVFSGFPVEGEEMHSKTMPG
jgi:hypothetical protein